jgi:hypothetical protein
MGPGTESRRIVPGTQPVLGWEKLFFAAVGLSALWIGFWGYFLPAIQKSIPFPIPALHARFLGAMYLSAFVMLLGGFRAGRWDLIGVVPVMTGTWTGGIFVVSLIHLDLFDFSTPQTWIWMVAYGVYPVIALWLVWAHRDHLTGSAAGAPAPRGVNVYLAVQGAVLLLLAAALFLAPAAMVDRWPWPITDSLAQLYAAPFLSYALGSLLLSRTPGWAQLRVGLVTMAVFAAGVLIASLIHRDLFSASEPADRLWFGLFAVAAAYLALLSVRSLRDG